MKDTVVSVASELVREVLLKGQASVKIDKIKLTSLRAPLHTICLYEQLNVATRYKKETGMLHVFKVGE